MNKFLTAVQANTHTFIYDYEMMVQNPKLFEQIAQDLLTKRTKDILHDEILNQIIVV